MTGKTNKMVRKRFKVTGTGKFLRKRAATNHFNARRSRKNMRMKRKMFATAAVNDKSVIHFLPFK